MIPDAGRDDDDASHGPTRIVEWALIGATRGAAASLLLVVILLMATLYLVGLLARGAWQVATFAATVSRRVWRPCDPG